MGSAAIKLSVLTQKFQGNGAATKLSVLTRKFQRNLQDYGWSVALKKTLAHLFSPLYFHQIYRIHKLRLDTAKPRKNFDRGDFAFRILTTQDEDAIAQIENLEEWLRGKLKDRIAAGQLCLVVLYREKVVGFYLISFGRAFLPLVKLHKRLHQTDAWSEHVTVRKEFQMRGLAPHLVYNVCDELRKRGIRRLYGGILPSNLASLRLARSVGFEKVVDIHYRRLLLFENWQYKRVRD